MNTLYVDAKYSDDKRRDLLYSGQVFVYSSTPAVNELAQFARELILEAFGGADPLTIQNTMPVEKCVEILSELKPRFIHHPTSKQLIQKMLAQFGCDLEQTYFDVPRLRTAFPSDYLSSGIAYAFHPHRDTWYSAPMCQLNWWFPVFEVNSNNVMTFHPEYWEKPLKNSSRGYNYYEWNAQSRKSASQHIKQDTRVQPKPEEPVNINPQVRVVSEPGGVMVFSAAQLHSTVPNDSGLTRYSIDFRTVHIGDAAARIGAPNVDSECTGTTMRDYLRGTDFSHIPEEVISLYNDGTEVRGQLVYPAVKVEAASTNA